MSPEVEAAFDAIDPALRAVLLQVRDLILECDIPVQEALRWGQPSYLSEKGTTLRLGITKAGQPSVFTHCQSTVMADVRAVVGERFAWDGTRGVSWPVDDDLPKEMLELLIARALSYHQR